MLRRAAVVGSLTLVSRIAGFARDLVMARVLGAGLLADTFMIAFRLPNHFRSIIAEGGFNAAFVPTYSGILAKEGDGAAREFRATVQTWLLLINAVLLLIGVIGAAYLVRVLAPGFTDDPMQFQLATTLTRITFPYLFCISLLSLYGGVLNSHGHFVLSSTASVLLNLCMIATLLVASYFPTAAHAAAWGVLISGVAQLVMVAVGLVKSHLSMPLRWPTLTPEMRVFFKRFGPAVLGASGVQLAVFADTIIASLLPTGSMSYLYYADRIYQLPLGIVGIALGTVLLPDLARSHSLNNLPAMRHALGRSLGIGLLTALPCTGLFIGVGDWLMVVLFQHGRFTAEASAGATTALVAYSFGLPAAIMIRPLVSGFHARGDTMTPFKVLAVATAVNLALKALFAVPLGHTGLALATSCGVTVNAGILYFLLRRDGLVVIDRSLAAMLAAGVAGLVVMLAVSGATRNWAMLEFYRTVPLPGWHPEIAAWLPPFFTPLFAMIGIASLAYVVTAAVTWFAVIGRFSFQARPSARSET